MRDAKQVGRYRKPDGPAPNQTTDLRLREGYKIVRMIVESFDEKTARAWLFGTNTRLDDEAPIDVLRQASVRRSSPQSVPPPGSLLASRGERGRALAGRASR